MDNVEIVRRLDTLLAETRRLRELLDVVLDRLLTVEQTAQAVAQKFTEVRP